MGLFKSAIEKAIRAGDAAAVSRLLSSGVSANKLIDGRLPLLALAACLGNDAIVRELLERGADANAQFTIGDLEAASQNYAVPFVGADVRLKVGPLFAAFWRSDYGSGATVASLIKNAGGALATGSFAEVKKVERGVVWMMVRTLTRNQEASVPAINGRRLLALLAADGAHAGALANGQTPLLNLISAGAREAALVLAETGTDVNVAARDEENGVGPLSLAIVKGMPEVARALAHSGADVNAADLVGMTPLRVALSARSAEMVQMLLARGADCNFDYPGRKTEFDAFVVDEFAKDSRWEDQAGLMNLSGCLGMVFAAVPSMATANGCRLLRDGMARLPRPIMERMVGALASAKPADLDGRGFEEAAGLLAENGFGLPGPWQSLREERLGVSLARESATVKGSGFAKEESSAARPYDGQGFVREGAQVEATLVRTGRGAAIFMDENEALIPVLEEDQDGAMAKSLLRVLVPGDKAVLVSGADGKMRLTGSPTLSVESGAMAQAPLLATKRARPGC